MEDLELRGSGLPAESVGAIFGHAFSFILNNIGVLLMYALILSVISFLSEFAVTLSQSNIIVFLLLTVANIYVNVVTMIMQIKVIDCVYRKEEFNLAGLLEHAHSRFWTVVGLGLIAGICAAVPLGIFMLIVFQVPSWPVKIGGGLLLAIPIVYLMALFSFIRVMPAAEGIEFGKVEFGDCIDVARANMKLMIMLTLCIIVISSPIVGLTYMMDTWVSNPYVLLAITAVLTLFSTLIGTSVTYVAYRVLREKMTIQSVDDEAELSEV